MERPRRLYRTNRPEPRPGALEELSRGWETLAFLEDRRAVPLLARRLHAMGVQHGLGVPPPPGYEDGRDREREADFRDFAELVGECLARYGYDEVDQALAKLGGLESWVATTVRH